MTSLPNGKRKPKEQREMTNDELGPAMSACNERERNFGRALLAGNNQTRAALAAGYGNGKPDSAKVTGSNLMDRPRIRARPLPSSPSR